MRRSKYSRVIRGTKITQGEIRMWSYKNGEYVADYKGCKLNIVCSFVPYGFCTLFRASWVNFTTGEGGIIEGVGTQPLNDAKKKAEYSAENPLLSEWDEL